MSALHEGNLYSVIVMLTTEDATTQLKEIKHISFQRSSSKTEFKKTRGGSMLSGQVPDRNEKSILMASLSDNVKSKTNWETNFNDFFYCFRPFRTVWKALNFLIFFVEILII